MFNARQLTAAFAGAVALLWQGQAIAAAGYGVGHETITGAGVAYAGGAAAASDAGTVHYNPAGMSFLGRDEISVGFQNIFPTVKFENQGSVIFDGSPLTGTNRTSGGKFALIPNAFFVKRYNDKVSYGIGVTGPWGLVTDYDQDWLGRYNEITTSLRVINVNPSVSYKITDQFSVGVGFDVQYAIGKLRQAIDFGTVCAAALGPAVCNAGFGLQPQQDDGLGAVKGRDWGFGYNVGMLWQPMENLRLGAHYRSHVKLDFDGKAGFEVPAGARAFFTAAGVPTAFTNTDANFDLTIPEQASVSGYFKFDPQWAAMADLTWTRWSRFPNFTATFADPATPTNVLTTNWKNVIRVAGGVEHYYSDALTLRGGFAFDDSPIPDSTRGPGIPDSDHYTIGTGASYKITDRLTADFSYIHMFYKTGPANRISGTGSRLIGNFRVNVDVLGIGFRWAL